jgi:hypothetical protein
MAKHRPASAISASAFQHLRFCPLPLPMLAALSHFNV